MRRWLPTIALLLVAILGYIHWRTVRYDPLIEKYCERYRLDFYLVKSIICEESGFSASARGEAGELGLMQVMPYVGEEFWRKVQKKKSYDPDKLLEPEHNIQVGCWYLRDSLDRYRQRRNPLPFALARYNAGESRVARWVSASVTMPENAFVDQIDFPHTRAYVLRVMGRSKQRSHFYWW